MGKKSKVLVNYIYSVIYQLLNILLPIVTAPYIARVLNADGVGRYNYVVSVVSTFILFAQLGTAAYATRGIAYVRDVKKAASQLFWDIVLLRVVTTLVTLVVFIIFIFSADEVYRKLYLIQGMALVSVAFDISWFFQGREEFKKTVTRNMVVRVISVIFMFIFIRNAGDVDKYCFVVAAPNLVGNIWLWGYLKGVIKKPKINFREALAHLKPSFTFFLPATATYIYTTLDKVVLGILSTEAEVGYYSQSEKIVKLTITLLTSLSTVLMPRIANQIKKEGWNGVENEIEKVFHFVGIIALPLIFGIIGIASIFVPVFFGPGYEKSIIVMQILSPLALIMGFASITGSVIMIPLGRQNKYTLTAVAGSLINLLLNLLLIPSYQSVGAAVATIIAECTVTGLQFYFIRDKVSFIKTISLLWKSFVSVFVMCIAMYLVRPLFEPTWVSILEVVVISAVVYFGSLFFLKDTMILDALNIFFKRVKK